MLTAAIRSFPIRPTFTSRAPGRKAGPKDEVATFDAFSLHEHQAPTTTNTNNNSDGHNRVFDQQRTAVMVDFFDLPRTVRDRIYRLHLVKADGPLTLDEHYDRVESSALSKKYMPSIMEISKRAEKEAGPIYYGENHFDIGDLDAFWRFSTSTWPRHLNLVRAITCAWTGDSNRSWSIGNYGNYGATRSNFIRMSKMKRLESLNIRVDEAEMVRRMTFSRETRQRPFEGNDISAQEGLAIFQFPGMAGLLSITKVRNVQFIKLLDDKGEEHGGPLADGPLLTHILPRLRPQVKVRRKYVQLLSSTMSQLMETDK